MCILASVFCGSSPSILQQTREETSLAGFPTVIMNKNLSLIQGLRKWQQPPKILQFFSSWDYLVKTGKLEVLFHISESTKCYQWQRRVLGLLANYQVYDNEHHFLPKEPGKGMVLVQFHFYCNTTFFWCLSPSMTRMTFSLLTKIDSQSNFDIYVTLLIIIYE